MAAVSTAVAAPIITRPVSHHRKVIVFPSPVVGLPQIRVRGNIRCSIDTKEMNKKAKASTTAATATVLATGMIGATGPSLALVDERLTTEGTGLSLGLSNNLLGWILLGVFGLIWALYFAYTSTLEEDEESGLSL
ncbi:photosystem II reaction center W protein, chloroplastic [Phalaenopsis equestris]|uniref:photosystem II reaction center W protein, chloroplastic n=1 Tax=Phalaenopsis equestris TaxID=78828 RepID=UPI0009E5AF14|nr:photosystem II reaction center W protein, chloroplastic [Phalaenopsis equestris]